MNACTVFNEETDAETGVTRRMEGKRGEGKTTVVMVGWRERKGRERKKRDVGWVTVWQRGVVWVVW